VSQIIVYDDTKFYRCASGYYSSRDGHRLHRYKWEKEMGPIPEGHHIHHKDENKDNNELSNYESLPGSEHLSKHGKNPERIKLLLEVGVEGRKLAAEWHKSEEAREFAKKNWPGSLGLYMDKMVTKTCGCCGKEYEISVFASWGSKFCSSNCKSKARRKSGVDNETRTCAVCGEEFVTNKYGKTKTCSKECGAISSALNRKGKKQRPRKVMAYG